MHQKDGFDCNLKMNLGLMQFLTGFVVPDSAFWDQTKVLSENVVFQFNQIKSSVLSRDKRRLLQI